MSDYSNVRRVYAVSELAAEARFVIEERFPMLWVEGEVSNLRRPGSGHWYFSLKDDRAQIRCAMFASRNRFIRTPIRDGMGVLVRCRLSLYENRGEFQAIVEHVEPAGEGALRAAFERLRGALEGEGLFAAERKRPLPAFPRRIGIVSSLSGAALRDVLAVLQRRYPLVEALCLPVTVQGIEATSQIADALDQAQALRPPLDLIVLTRGGGSLEDLAAFNSEPLARRIARCTIPVVSAVGHETDVTIADLVADHRAPTPSAAAELIVPDKAELLARLRTAATTLARRMTGRVDAERRNVGALSRRLVDPARAIEQRMQRADELRERLERAMRHRLDSDATRLRHVRGNLGRASPAQAIERGREQASQAWRRLARAVERRLESAGVTLQGTARALDAVSPLNTLSRGYAVVSQPDGTRWGRVVTDVAHLAPGDRIDAHLVASVIEATVVATRPAPAAEQANKK